MKNISLNAIDSQKLSSTSQQCREFFNAKWQLYQKVLGNNYMGHQEMYYCLHQFLDSYFQRSFRILDLGCGDSSFMAKALLDTNIAGYLGIDLSEIALEIASNNMQGIAGELEFMQGDFREILPHLKNGEKHRFEVIASSFALHHLTLEQKSIIFNQIHQLLSPGGVFLLIDIVAKVTESRDTFIQRYLDGVRQSWLQLTPTETSIVSTHMLESDFPETEETLQLLAKDNGFSRQESIYQNPAETARLICFYA